MRRCNSDTICLGSGILRILLSRNWDNVANEILQSRLLSAVRRYAHIGIVLVTEWSQKSSRQKIQNRKSHGPFECLGSRARRRRRNSRA